MTDLHTTPETNPESGWPVIGDDGLEGIVIGEGSGAGEAHLALQRHAKALRARGDLTPDMPSMRCVGYRQVWDTLDGRAPADTLRERGRIHAVGNVPETEAERTKQARDRAQRLPVTGRSEAPRCPGPQPSRCRRVGGPGPGSSPDPEETRQPPRDAQ